MSGWHPSPIVCQWRLNRRAEMLLRAARQEEEEEEEDEGAVSYGLIPLLWRTTARSPEAPKDPVSEAPSIKEKNQTPGRK